MNHSLPRFGSFTLSIIVASFFLLPMTGNSQKNDCAEALIVCDSASLEFNPMGPGFDDFADPDNNEGCIVDLEQNSAWYYFEIDPLAPPNVEIGFIISPNGGYGEDYDWALYGPDANCGNLGFPIRCSSSSAFCGFCPETGMGMGATDFSEGPGTGDGFVATLIVQPGQGFYLLIDNWQGTNNGFVLTWQGTAAEWLNCAAEPPCALAAFAGDDIDACEGEDGTFQLDGGIYGNHGSEVYEWTGTNGGTDFLDNPNLQDPTVTIPDGFTGTITYTLMITEDTCSSEDQVEVIVHSSPNLNIFPVGPFCANSPSQTLVATPPGGQWGGDNTGNTFNPVLNGPGNFTVTYTYTNGAGCSSTESIDIIVHDLPTVTIDPDPAEFCDNEGSILLTATGEDGAGGWEFNWNTPTGTGIGETYDATLSGLHRVTVTDDNGCTNTSVVNVIAHSNPDVEIAEPGPICQSLPAYQMTAVPNTGEWSGANISPDGELYPDMLDPGAYTISYLYIDQHGCEGTDTETITIVETPDAIASNNGPLCEGQLVLLFGETSGTGSEITYQWSGPGGFTSILQNPTNATLAGPYILQVTIDGCPSENVVTDVELTDQPDATASNSGPYCSGQSIQLFGSTTSTSGSITYAWTGPNGYTSNVQNPTNAVDSGTYSLIITAGTCSSIVDTTGVIFGTAPDASASNSGPYCSGELVELFGNTNTSGTTVTYNWTGPGGFTSALQNPNGALQAGQYQLVVNVDGCNSVAQSTNVQINVSPTPIITGQDTFCTGFSSILNAGGGYSGYLWGNASTNPTLEVFSSGTYNVTVTDANGCTGAASMNVTEATSLTPTITGTLSFCEGSSTVLDAGSGFASYQWSGGETSQTIVVTDGGNYGVIVMDADGCSGSANVTTIVNPNPNVVIGGSTTYCIGGFTVLDAGAGYSSYTWSNSATSQTITVTTPGTYSVDIIDANGCAGSASVSVIESTSLSPVITGGTAFCENGSTTLNAGSGFATYIWSDGSMNQNLVVNTTGTYSVTVSDGQGCSGNSSVAVTEVLPPSAVVSPAASLCNTLTGGSVINLYSLVTGGDMNGTWADIDNSGAVGLFTNLNFDNIPAGNYRFEYTTNSAVPPCPEATYQVVVTVLECNCPDVLFLFAAPLCNAGDILDLSTIENTAETGIWSVIQSPAGSNPASLAGSILNPTGSDAGDYLLQFTLTNPQPPGCPPDYQISVHVDEEVNAGVAAPPVSYCADEDEVVNLLSMITGGDPGGTWKETSGTPSQGNAFSPTNATFRTANQTPATYTFEYSLASNGACPADAAVVSIIINALPVVTIASPPNIDCANATQIIDATGSSFGGNFNVSWSGPGIVTGTNTLQPTVDAPGDYELTIRNTLTGCVNSDIVSIISNTDPPSAADITIQNPSCFGDTDASIIIDQVIGGTPPYQYSLNNGTLTSNDIFNQLATGSYDVEIVDANGCRWDTVITIDQPVAFQIDLGADIEIEFGDSGTIQAIISLPLDQLDTLIWTPEGIVQCFDVNCLGGIVNAFNTVTLTATVFDINGCSVSDQVLVTVDKSRRIFIPNVFSPNDDGSNDKFYIMGSDRQIRRINKFQVYNRWGSLMYEEIDFQPNDPAHGWDGQFKDTVLNPGVFAYVAEVEYRDGLVEVMVGNVTLIK